ncbi:nucleoside kinase [Puteibacter caeruleilacunae]|nr:nucleoside kinase [Puteibacter caeruleilacunae]
MKNIEIYCENNGVCRSYPLGTTLLEIAEDLKVDLKFQVLGALVNNKAKELQYEIVKPKNVEFIDYTHPEGRRMYVRSLMFVLYSVVSDLFPDVTLSFQHGIAKGYFCEMQGLERDITDEDIFLIREEMKALIDQNIPFERKGMRTEKVIKLFKKSNLEHKARLFRDKGNLYSYVHFLRDKVNYFYGHLVPETGYLGVFDIERFHNGLLLRVPSTEREHELMDFVPQNKLFGIFQEHKDWAEIHNSHVVANLNTYIRKGKIGDVIKISEALHERKIVEIASQIYDRREDLKIVLIAGPSSSGKTTFSKRLAVQLAVSGMSPIMISMDNYFVNREETPKDENGEYDFESIHAIDIDYFNKDLLALLSGEKIRVPNFDFKSGKRFFNGKELRLRDGNILIIEGIHGLNPQLTPMIEDVNKFKIFISALTQINIDLHNYIPTTDNRLIRRIIRDSRYRNYSALDTIRRWRSVRVGEEKYIFPYQENADIMFNSALIYELCVLKRFAEPLLKTVPENQKEYSEAVRLLKFFAYVKAVEDTEIPPTSLLREFLGGSSFAY